MFLQIAPFAVLAQGVIDDNIGATALVQARDHIRPDKARSTRDQQHAAILMTRGTPLPHSDHARNTRTRRQHRDASGRLPLTRPAISKITVNSIGWIGPRRLRCRLAATRARTPANS